MRTQSLNLFEIISITLHSINGKTTYDVYAQIDFLIIIRKKTSIGLDFDLKFFSKLERKKKHKIIATITEIYENN